MNDMLLEAYWSELPKGRENAATYERLCSMWRRDKRTVRRILHELSSFDNGDNYILIRSSHNTGFYKTDNTKEIDAYRAECLNRGKRTFAPLRKIDRVLAPESGQLSVMNNLKATRIACGYLRLYAVGACGCRFIHHRELKTIVATCKWLKNDF